MLQVDVDTQKGGMTLNDKFFVDFGAGVALPNMPFYSCGCCSARCGLRGCLLQACWSGSAVQAAARAVRALASSRVLTKTSACRARWASSGT